MTTLTLQPGLRPAPLPPTLQPHAVLSLAPPTDRKRSAALASVVYLLLGGGVLWLSHLGAVAVRALPSSIGPLTLNEPSTQVPAAPVKTPTVHSANPVTPAPPVSTHPESLNPSPLQPSQPLSPPSTPTPQPVGPQVAGTGQVSGPINISGSTVQVLHQVSPVYPFLAKASRLEGQVVIRMSIDTRGLPTQVEAISGPEVFKGPALQAARQWRFVPALQNGEPVPASFLLTLNFVHR